MKWSDIPKYISEESCYHVNYSLKGYIGIIQEWEQDEYYRLQMNPDFQRGHVWTEQQQIEFMEFLFKGGKTGKSFYFNKPSWRTQELIENYDDFVCVDGLQRTTAIQRFLNNEIPVFGCSYKEFDRPLRFSEYQIDIYVNDLKSKKEVLTWYIQMNCGGTPHTKDEIEKVKQLLKR